MGDYDDTLFWDSMDDTVVEHVLSLFTDEDITISSVPRTGLVMLTVKDSFDTDFHLGEVLVTDARVMCCGVEGFGMVVGESPRKAIARAVADAVLRSTGCVLKDRLTAMILREQSERNRRLSESAALVAATKVNFDLM
jgi:alpha-D-ribose 1-methylphosphonate 5-triphosphate synthase subunit PhnG